jgi:hypothetical protein
MKKSKNRILTNCLIVVLVLMNSLGVGVQEASANVEVDELNRQREVFPEYVRQRMADAERCV